MLGGIGIASGLAFGALSIIGALDRQSSHCDTGCPAGAYDRVNAEFIAADITLGAAALLVGIAIIDFVVTRPSSSRSRAAQEPLVVRF